MKSFARLFDELDSTTSTLEKVAALKRYFELAEAKDAIWVILLLTQKISRRVITSHALKNIFLRATSYPEWLYEDCHAHVGDTAETISLLLNSLGKSSTIDGVQAKPLSEWMESEIPNLAKIKDEDEKSNRLMTWWQSLPQDEIFLLNKLMTGGFRVGVSEKIVIRALAETYDLPSDQISHRLTGTTEPTPEAFANLISKEKTEILKSQPYPFCLAHAWNDRKEDGWDENDWCIEWKYDGIRSQVIKRDDGIWIWSRGEDEITATFPDLVELFQSLPNGTVLDGEILVIKDGHVMPFQDLQKRLGRKKVPPATLKQYPAGFIAYDILEHESHDYRSQPLRVRKETLRTTLGPLLKGNSAISISEILSAEDLKRLEVLRSMSREHTAEGVMVKSWNSPYTVGRKTGNWWKHKVDPLTLDAVLLYAQAGSGRRANLYTDYTFALWDEEKNLVPFAKAYSGLDQDEINQLDHWIRRHTKEKFGPVRSLEPFHVFEIGFEGILKSTRHKSGIAVRFPRILRWRKDKKVEDADYLSTAMGLLEANVASGTTAPSKLDAIENSIGASL